VPPATANGLQALRRGGRDERLRAGACSRRGVVKGAVSAPVRCRRARGAGGPADGAPRLAFRPGRPLSPAPRPAGAEAGAALRVRVRTVG